MSDMVGNPEAQFFHVMAQFIMFVIVTDGRPTPLSPEQIELREERIGIAVSYFILYEPSIEKTNNFVFLTRTDTNCAVQPQKKARGLKLRGIVLSE